MLDDIEQRLKDPIRITIDDIRSSYEFGSLFTQLRRSKCFNSRSLFTGVIGRGYEKLVNFGNYRYPDTLFAYTKSELENQSLHPEDPDNGNIFTHLRMVEGPDFHGGRYIVVWDSQKLYQGGPHIESEYGFLQPSRKYDSIFGVIPIEVFV